MMLLLLIFGVIGVNRHEITITTGDFEAKYYDKPITNHTWYISKGELRAGHTIDVKFTGEQIAVGESDNTVDVLIYDELGTDVTSDYKITYDLGLLKVNPRTLLITTASDAKIYDKKALTADSYYISDEYDALVLGHKLSVIISGEQTEIGSSHNTVSDVVIHNQNGEDVTRNYQLIIREGLLQVISDVVGETVIELNGNGTLSGGANRNDSMVLFVVYSDEDENIYLKTESFGDYNGQGWEQASSYSELIDDKYSAIYLTYDALKKGSYDIHEIKIKSLTDVYVIPYYLSNEHNLHEIQTSDIISEGDASDVYTVSYIRAEEKKLGISKEYSQFEKEYREYVYNNYLGIDSETLDYMNRIIAEEGIKYDSSNVFATIEQVAEYIKNCAEYDLDYNLNMDLEENIVIAFMEKYKEGLCRHYASAATLMFRALGIPARYTTGAVAEGVSNTWVEVPATKAHAWVEVYIDGMGWVMVEVTPSNENMSIGGLGSGNHPNTPKKYTVKPVTVAKKYDGTILDSVNKVTGLDDLVAVGYSYKVEVEGSRTEIGISESHIISLIVYDAAGNDVTDTLDIKLKNGKVHVYERKLKFSSESIKKVYDGALPPLGELTEGTLIEGHTYKVTSMATPNVGKSENDFNVKITDSTGKDITDHYYIEKSRGIVEITHLEITLKAKDAEKKYDGSKLICNEIELIDGELVNGHKINFFVVTGSQIAVGRSDNFIEYVSICDKSGNDVTKNYAIKYENGRLKVTYS